MTSINFVKTGFLFYIKPIFIMLCPLLISGCATYGTSPFEKSLYEAIPFQGSQDRKKHIFVLFDGTLNDPKTPTNIWRLFEALDTHDDPQKMALYIKGVGTARSKPLTGTALGRGMEERILKGYEYIARNYNSDDRIYIFGFSRGAHQARSLAGILSYAGVPAKVIRDEKEFLVIGNEIIDSLKNENDDDYKQEWIKWESGNNPLFSAKIKHDLGIEMNPVEMSFLGVWDTVPGSFFKEYDECKEKVGSFKRHFSWLPLISRGHRYKSDSYPPIKNIAHAVSIDEKRSKFKPILICRPAINDAYTKINEMWFPGAHADVGGGYEGQTELPNISLNWMIDLLNEVYEPNIQNDFKVNPWGIAHLSIKDSPGKTGSTCEDRIAPGNAIFHLSFQQRKDSAPVRVCVKEKLEMRKYPELCSDIKNNFRNSSRLLDCK